MTRHTKIALCAAACLGIFLVAPLNAAKAYEDALDACRKWTGQGAGAQYKCFDCMKHVDDGRYGHWVNTCAADSRYDGETWGYSR